MYGEYIAIACSTSVFYVYQSHPKLHVDHCYRCWCHDTYCYCAIPPSGDRTCRRLCVLHYRDLVRTAASYLTGTERVCGWDVCVLVDHEYRLVFARVHRPYLTCRHRSQCQVSRVSELRSLMA
ncbi:TPA: hypothetical protein N0F65_004359 [Lagenidium giganteum]|uniref:Uncharacterized protein n=1 Tax=Lagenidium giganteum TaxID=4803 RepID=A0AAV2ZIM5_9STRA|nr:TPA: hypothetical protein N0F65_004359 [Lagenidium giganteum]